MSHSNGGSPAVAIADLSRSNCKPKRPSSVPELDATMRVEPSPDGNVAALIGQSYGDPKRPAPSACPDLLADATQGHVAVAVAAGADSAKFAVVSVGHVILEPG